MTDGVYELRPRRVNAWRLTWANWEELTTKVKGRFHQGLQLHPGQLRSRMPSQGRVYLEVPNGENTVAICKMGDWVVEERPGEFGVWDDTAFRETFRPAAIPVVVRDPVPIAGGRNPK